MTVNVGIIGAGFMGKTHAMAFESIPDVRVVSIADAVKDKAQALSNVVRGSSVKDVEGILQDPAIDLVDISLPTPFHAEYSIRALESGKYVIVEKPLALSLEDADRMVEAAHRTSKFLMVAHVLRFWPEYVAVRSVLKGGRIGQPRQATAYRLSNGPQWAPWFRDPNMSGGAVLDLQIHDLDIFNWLFGKPQSVSAKGFRDEKGAWSHVMSLISYPTVQAFTEASYIFPRDFPFTTGLRVVCDEGVIEYYYRAGGASFEQGQPTTYLQVHQDGKPCQILEAKPGDAYKNEIAYFVDCVEKKIPPSIVTVEDARQAVKLALASRRSMETGAPVDLAE